MVVNIKELHNCYHTVYRAEIEIDNTIFSSLSRSHIYRLYDKQNYRWHTLVFLLMMSDIHRKWIL